jgi:hypothetical protein
MILISDDISFYVKKSKHFFIFHGSYDFGGKLNFIWGREKRKTKLDFRFCYYCSSSTEVRVLVLLVYIIRLFFQPIVGYLLIVMIIVQCIKRTSLENWIQ